MNKKLRRYQAFKREDARGTAFQELFRMNGLNRLIFRFSKHTESREIKLNLHTSIITVKLENIEGKEKMLRIVRKKIGDLQRGDLQTDRRSTAPSGWS